MQDRLYVRRVRDVKVENRRGYDAVVLIESRRAKIHNLLPYQGVPSNSGDRILTDDIDSLKFGVAQAK